MSSKIYKLQVQASPEIVAEAESVCGHLANEGFESKDFDDLVYGLAERLSHGYSDEVGVSSAQRLAQAEYNAAEEINQMSMNHQLVVLRASSGSLADFRQLIEGHLKLQLPLEIASA